MAKINDLLDFKNITSRITSFSHAYLFNVNFLEKSLLYIKDFAKTIILNNENITEEEKEDISYKIDNDEYDDLYIVNPTTIGINTTEITKLIQYMDTKSIHNNGRRVYIIYGFERLSPEVSNKVLKFLEEPQENIYALLITENIDKILTTIISRCQVINLSFTTNEENTQYIVQAKEFIQEIFAKKCKVIAYENKILQDILQDRLKMYEFFDTIEKIISDNLNKKYRYTYDKNIELSELDTITIDDLSNILNITNKLKCLIKGNINLNLLTDRYIIEITEVLDLCKK